MAYVRNIDSGLKMGREKVEYRIIYAANEAAIDWIREQAFSNNI